MSATNTDSLPSTLTDHPLASGSSPSGVHKMERDLFNGLSRAELKKEINAQVAADQRSLTVRAKTFSAVAKMQKFDIIPDVVTVEELDKLVGSGATELNRGLSSSNGLSAILYARELARGPLYPGTQVALGQGMYFASPSITYDQPGFSSISRVAGDYARFSLPGVIVRCALKHDAHCLESDELKDVLRDNRNRAREVGINDIGTLAASLGFDAYFCDGMYDHTTERVWVVVNRGALTFQNRVEKIGLQPAERPLT